MVVKVSNFRFFVPDVFLIFSFTDNVSLGP